MKKNVLLEKSFSFALNSIEEYQILLSKKEFIISKQFLRSATSVGANIREANNSESLKDFIHKLHISLKECDESQYWLELLFASNQMNESSYKNLMSAADEIKKILTSCILTSRSKLNRR
ncbi:MAG TPA: four helix bundle protein [Taishania sp.]|nr:four helix bundle protein [Taishania sp.]